MVSHELRTPLNAILGWSRILIGCSDSQLVERGLAVIERNAGVQSKLIEDILDVSRIVTGKVVIDARRACSSRMSFTTPSNRSGPQPRQSRFAST
jgi:signal transduction histidine kinase